MSTLTEACRCPVCATVFEAASQTRTVSCPACDALSRPRWLRHEPAMALRAAQAGRRADTWGRGVHLLVEDVRSLWNVGSFFRSMDGLGGVHLFLVGICGIPPHDEIRRTALGADETVSWSYRVGALPVIEEARTRGVPVIALESTPGATDLQTAPRPPSALVVVGNEVEGISPEVLARCDTHVHIPMRGHKASLNVAVAAGLALWHYGASAEVPAEVPSGPP